MKTEEYLEKIKALYGESLYEEYKDGYHEYEWELGSYVVDTLLHYSNDILIYNTYEVTKLFGYPVRICNDDLGRIKLWREVKV